jgi:hypothetical protein
MNSMNNYRLRTNIQDKCASYLKDRKPWTFKSRKAELQETKIVKSITKSNLWSLQWWIIPNTKRRIHISPSKLWKKYTGREENLSDEFY